MPKPSVYRPQLRAGLLQGSLCESCDFAVSPALPRCPSCGGESVAADFPARGRVWSSTVIRIRVGDREPPYGLAYVDVADGPRVLAGFAGDTPLKVGEPVNLVEHDHALAAEPEVQ